MSRTYRSTTYHWLRRPKGRINAKRNNARAGAVPPDPWDDITSADKDCDHVNFGGTYNLMSDTKMSSK